MTRCPAHGSEALVAAVHGGEPHRDPVALLGDRVDDAVVCPGCRVQPVQILKFAAQRVRAELRKPHIFGNRGQPGSRERTDRSPTDAFELAEGCRGDALGDRINPYAVRFHDSPGLTAGFLDSSGWIPGSHDSSGPTASFHHSPDPIPAP